MPSRRRRRVGGSAAGANWVQRGLPPCRLQSQAAAAGVKPMGLAAASGCCRDVLQTMRLGRARAGGGGPNRPNRPPLPPVPHLGLRVLLHQLDDHPAGDEACGRWRSSSSSGEQRKLVRTRRLPAGRLLTRAAGDQDGAGLVGALRRRLCHRHRRSTNSGRGWGGWRGLLGSWERLGAMGGGDGAIGQCGGVQLALAAVDFDARRAQRRRMRSLTHSPPARSALQ